MDKLSLKTKRLTRRRNHIKKKIRANKERLRLCVSRSNMNMYAQIIDDTKSTTVVGVSTQSKGFPDLKNRGNIKAAQELGKMLAAEAVKKGIKTVVFDRNGLLYHGKVKAFADAARENGLEF